MRGVGPAARVQGLHGPGACGTRPHCAGWHLHACSMKSGLTLGDFGWGSKTFAKMGREKIRLISIFLKVSYLDGCPPLPLRALPQGRAMCAHAVCAVTAPSSDAS